jgi:hypothetical protein
MQINTATPKDSWQGCSASISIGLPHLRVSREVRHWNLAGSVIWMGCSVVQWSVANTQYNVHSLNHGRRTIIWDGRWCGWRVWRGRGGGAHTLNH